jgi:hypothetical protein
MAQARGIPLRDRATVELVKELSGQVSTLVRQEADLAKAEMAEKGKEAGIGTGLFAGAAMAALLMLGSLTAFLILVLALALPAWSAALIVTGLWAGVAVVLALQGRNRLRAMGTPIPEQRSRQ